jgi:hypothetical protein
MDRLDRYREAFSTVRTERNMPGHILTLTDRPSFRPESEKCWPGRENLAHHRREVFIR